MPAVVYTRQKEQSAYDSRVCDSNFKAMDQGAAGQQYVSFHAANQGSVKVTQNGKPLPPGKGSEPSTPTKLRRSSLSLTPSSSSNGRGGAVRPADVSSMLRSLSPLKTAGRIDSAHTRTNGVVSDNGVIPLTAGEQLYGQGVLSPTAKGAAERRRSLVYDPSATARSTTSMNGLAPSPRTPIRPPFQTRRSKTENSGVQFAETSTSHVYSSSKFSSAGGSEYVASPRTPQQMPFSSAGSSSGRFSRATTPTRSTSGIHGSQPQSRLPTLLVPNSPTDVSESSKYKTSPHAECYSPKGSILSNWQTAESPHTPSSIQRTKSIATPSTVPSASRNLDCSSGSSKSRYSDPGHEAQLGTQGASSPATYSSSLNNSASYLLRAKRYPELFSLFASQNGTDTPERSARPNSFVLASKFSNLTSNADSSQEHSGQDVYGYSQLLSRSIVNDSASQNAGYSSSEQSSSGGGVGGGAGGGEGIAAYLQELLGKMGVNATPDGIDGYAAVHCYPTSKQLKSEQEATTIAQAPVTYAPDTADRGCLEDAPVPTVWSAVPPAQVPEGFEASPNLPGYLLGKVIGEGGFCKVFMGIHNLSQGKVAIKALDSEKIQDDKEQRRIQREIRVLKHLNHECIIKLFDLIEAPSKLYIVMEHAPNGSLLDYVRAKKRLPESEACYLFQQIVAGLQYCHEQEVVHRDVKLENILLDADNNMKIIDFGLSAFFTPGKTLKVHCGSPSYAAPEIVARKTYAGPPVDVWSLGVVLFAMLCGYLPFHSSAGNKQELCNKIMSGVFTAPDWLSESAKDLLNKMLNVDPDRRITFPSVWHHPWITGAQLKWNSMGRSMYMTRMNSFTGDYEYDQEVIQQLQNKGLSAAVTKKHLVENQCTYHTTSYCLLLEQKAAMQRKEYACN